MKDCVSGYLRASNVLTGPKHCWNLPAVLLCNCFITLGDIELENIPLNKISNLRMFVNSLNVDDKYFCYKRERFSQAVHMQLSKKPNIFYQIFIAFLECTSNFQQIEKKDEPQSSTNSKIIDSEKGWVFKSLKDCASGHPSAVHVSTSDKHWHHCYPVLSSVSNILDWKVSLLVISEMLKVFVDAMTSNSKYSCYKMDKLPQSIQIQLSKKNKYLLSIFYCSSTI